jgi:hypothetical protein
MSALFALDTMMESRYRPSTEPYLPHFAPPLRPRISRGNDQKKEKRQRAEVWLEPELNRLYLHYSYNDGEWKADAVHPLPSLLILLYTYIVPQNSCHQKKKDSDR